MGIKPMTFKPIVQCLNQPCYHVMPEQMERFYSYQGFIHYKSVQHNTKILTPNIEDLQVGPKKIK
jgi:hypothetical protein